jgi:hypothetical protein
MPALLTLQQIIDGLTELDDEELQELRDEIDDEIADREGTDELEVDEDEDAYQDEEEL